MIRQNDHLLKSSTFYKASSIVKTAITFWIYAWKDGPMSFNFFFPDNFIIVNCICRLIVATMSIEYQLQIHLYCPAFTYIISFKLYNNIMKQQSYYNLDFNTGNNQGSENSKVAFESHASK